MPNKLVFERAAWAQNGDQDALKRDRAKASRWGQWKEQVRDMKNDAYLEKILVQKIKSKSRGTI